MIHIYVDAMGGDHAPQSTVEGSIKALRANAELKITLGGREDAIKPYLEGADDVLSRLEIDPCSEEITNHEAPAMAVRQKKDSAIVKGMLRVREKACDGFVSSGSTGAVLTAGMLRLGRIPGIERPAIAPLLPNGKDFFLLIDGGANVDCKPHWLVQFGIMGDAYMKGVRGIAKPRIGLLNNGAEAEKGCALTKEAYPMMEQAPFHFVGNIEGRYVTADHADVIVCDGFVGNMVLKFMEGVAGTLLSMIKTQLMAGLRTKIGALLAKPAFKRVKKAMDYQEVGGAPLLGVQGAVIKAHGSCNAHAFYNAIVQCIKMVEGDVVSHITTQVKSLAQSEGETEHGS